MSNNKRVTVTVELVDIHGKTTWCHTETAEHNTGDNPLRHWSDAQIALDSAGRHAISAMQHRFGDFREL